MHFNDNRVRAVRDRRAVAFRGRAGIGRGVFVEACVIVEVLNPPWLRSIL
jgi:hypothetical protein